jgi:nucleoside-triphosphatase THEP1
MQQILSKPLRQIWLKASVVGSIWASIEIILGSFLHNLRIPLSGMVLSFISVWLLISFLQVWKENGLILRAGLICALMKSISPSAIIFGPMIGILTEAVLIEIIVFILGKNLVGYIVGGAFAVLSTILHKLVSLLIFYGFNFIKILSDLYLYAVKQIDLEQLSPVYLIAFITAIYILTGLVAAIGGYMTGLKYNRLGSRNINPEEIILQSKNQMFGQTDHQDYSLFFLLISALSVTGILLLLNFDLIILSIIIAVIYVGFCLINYKNSLKRLKKLSFWIIFLVITFAAAFLWNGFSGGAFFSLDGLIVGLKMNARAIIMVIGFASISVELRNPLIKSILYQRGFASLYQSLSLSFSALPFFISGFPRQEKGKGMPKIKFMNLFTQAEVLLGVFDREHQRKPQVVILTGNIHEGKTTFAQKVISDLHEQKIRFAGFLSIGINANGERTGFNLLDLESSESIELCSDTEEENRFQLGKYFFNEAALARGNEILNVDNLSDKQLIVIDEIGPLELSGKGWSSSIENITRSITVPHLWIVRKSLVNNIIRKWNIGNAYIFDISESSTLEVENKLIEIIFQNPSAEEYHQGL